MFLGQFGDAEWWEVENYEKTFYDKPVVPEIDMDIYNSMLANAGIHPISEPKILTRSELHIPYDERYYRKETHVTDYAMEQGSKGNEKKVHIYSRKERFRFTVRQLLGISGHVPNSVIRLVRKEMPNKIRTNSIWNAIRSILKRHGYSIYYNRIPYITKCITGMRIFVPTHNTIRDMYLEFYKMSHQFDTTLKKKWARKYFPNMRFIALKLMDKHKVQVPYNIPLVRTSRKKKYLEGLYKEFE